LQRYIIHVVAECTKDEVVLRCTLGEDSAAAAALDGLLAAGDGDSPGGGGSSSTADGIVDCNCFFMVLELFVAVFSIWYLLYGRWGGYQNDQKMIIS
jgi:hypothetical protein